MRACATPPNAWVDLIDDLLKLSRLSRAQVQRIDVDLSQIARDIAGELERAQPGAAT